MALEGFSPSWLLFPGKSINKPVISQRTPCVKYILTTFLTAKVYDQTFEGILDEEEFSETTKECFGKQINLCHEPCLF